MTSRTKKITVVISQAQGKNPARRRLEEDIAARLIMQPDVDVSIVPNLYDMAADHTGMLFLQSVPGNLVVLAWLYPRAARWVLDRHGVHGREGVTLLTGDDEEDEADEQPERQGIGPVDLPDRNIYCIDLRAESNPDAYVEEIRRIAGENSQQTVDLMSWIGGQPKAEQLQRYLNPVAREPSGNGASGGNGAGDGQGEPLPIVSPPDDEPVKRRWYPVIDYSRCTNCMECIDFCLFGVYGVDKLDRILVESQDNCKKGCPACSRVCPENAIIFPHHKSSAIAGADGEVAGLKIDLSELFGGKSAGDALETAVAERDAELVKDGRDAVGMTVGIPKRQADRSPDQRDELDDLMDGLDSMGF